MFEDSFPHSSFIVKVDEMFQELEWRPGVLTENAVDLGYRIHIKDFR